MGSELAIDALKAELAQLDTEPHNPIVFKDEGDADWTVLSFRPFNRDTRPTWREAYDLAYTLARVRGTVIEATQECS